MSRRHGTDAPPMSSTASSSVAQASQQADMMKLRLSAHALDACMLAPTPSHPPDPADYPNRHAWADEMFDLTAPSVDKPMIARLLAVRPALRSIDLSDDAHSCEFVLGRGSDLDPMHRIRGCAALSAEHCHIVVDPLTRKVTVRDVSKNGCFINGKRIKKNVCVELSQGDALSLTKPTAAAVSAASEIRDGHDKPHSGISGTGNSHDGDDDGKDKDSSAVVYLFQRIQAERCLRDVIAETTCVLCQSVYYHPCTLTPCLHACCASCLSHRMHRVLPSRAADETRQRKTRRDSHGSTHDHTGDDCRSEEKGSAIVAHTLTCPTCDGVVYEVRPSRRLSQLAALVQQRCSEYALSAQERIRRDAVDTIPAAGLTLINHEDTIHGDRHTRSDAKDGQEHRDSDADSADEPSLTALSDAARPVKHARLMYHEATGWPIPRLSCTLRPQHPCRHCTKPSPIDGFRCRVAAPAAGGNSMTVSSSHVVCAACNGLMPHRPLLKDRPMRCPGCHASFCNLYYGDAGDGGGCPAQGSRDSTVFQALRSFVFAELPPTTFGGNTIEQAILTCYLSRRAISVQAVYQHCLDYLDANRWSVDNFVLLSLVPLTGQRVVCVRCATRIFADLLLHYRMAIPRGELPDAVRNRQNCWHGKECVLQWQTRQHALQYSHVCYQQKSKE